MRSLIILSTLVLFAIVQAQNLQNRVVYAVNCGGGAHRGAYGIYYDEDTSTEGIASEHGKAFAVINAPAEDRLLYQIERYAFESLTYSVPSPGDGDYVLILKFSEVYFRAVDQKVFDVVVNSVPVILDLDIFAAAGSTGMAHDRYIPFSIVGNEIQIEDNIIDMNHGVMEISFVKGRADNPKINAIVILKGNLNGLPHPPQPVFPHQIVDDVEEEEEAYDEVIQNNYQRQQEGEIKKQSSEDVASGPRVKNPFDEKSDNSLLMVLAAIVCLLPLIVYVKRL